MASKQLRLSGELVLISLVIGGINLFFPESPGFVHSSANPFVLVSLLVAAYYGRYRGFLFLSCSVAIVLGPLPPLLALIDSSALPGAASRNEIVAGGLTPLAIAVVGVYVFGFIRDSGHAQRQRILKRLRSTIREKVVIGRKAGALEQVNRELEERVFRQSDSLTALYSQVQALHSYDLRRALDALLEIIERFSHAGSASVWEYVPDAKELRLVAHRGATSGGRSITILPEGGSIEGWVVRNDMMFSVRMLNRYVNLREIDDGRNIMTMAIKAGSRIWGVLNIEAMPFERYNRHTERLLQVIMALVSPALEKAVDNETTIAGGESDRRTGLPTYSQFHAILEKDLYRTQLQKGHLSVIILEIANAEDLRKEHGDEKYYALLGRMVAALGTLTESKARLFRYQQENQLALLYPNLDFDGASLSCLEILSMVTSTEWIVDEHPVSIDAVVGYASLGEKKQTVDDLLDAAEHLLDMQKV